MIFRAFSFEYFQLSSFVNGPFADFFSYFSSVWYFLLFFSSAMGAFDQRTIRLMDGSNLEQANIDIASHSGIVKR